MSKIQVLEKFLAERCCDSFEGCEGCYYFDSSRVSSCACILASLSAESTLPVKTNGGFNNNQYMRVYSDLEARKNTRVDLVKQIEARLEKIHNFVPVVESLETLAENLFEIEGLVSEIKQIRHELV